MRAPIRWIKQPAAPQEFLIQLRPDLHPLVGQLLWSRGLDDPDKVDRFLQPSWAHLHDARQLRDMDRAVARILRARAEGQRIAVYGDYDTDGVTGVALLHQALTAMGFDVLPYIPKRNEEGYGLNRPAVEELASKTGLLITVDCGISNVSEIAHANALGLDVIVLDHHTPPAVLPAGEAVVNPKRPGCDYPYKMLAGVGVAFKLVQALVRAGLTPAMRSRELLDIVALGTVTDMAPLDGENRVLVKYGLDAINATPRPGLQALIEVAAVKGPVDCRTISWVLGPRINAAGRLDDAVRAYHLLLCDDPAIARGMAAEIDKINSDRRDLTKEMFGRAEELARRSGKADRRIVILDGEGVPSGIVGLVAGRLAELFARPVLLVERGEDEYRGSARSIAGFSIVDALTECGDVFIKFGGHAMAAGFSLAPHRLPELEERLGAIGLRDLTDEMLVRKLLYEAELPLAQQSWELMDQLQELEPFGQGNPEPVWVTRDVEVLTATRMGGERQHLKLRVHDGRGATGEVVAWRQGERQAEFPRGARVDVAYTLEVNAWQGQDRLQMNAKDVRRTNGEGYS